MRTLDALVSYLVLSTPCNQYLTDTASNYTIDSDVVDTESDDICPTMADLRTTYICPKECYKEDDGDSFYCGEVEIRLLGADTPEIRHPKDGIFINQDYGLAAAGFTYQTLTEAQTVTISEGGIDKYGRVLAHVDVDGELLSVKLIEVGLAYETISTYGDNGMPEYANQILSASYTMPTPKFKNPHDWRKEHQQKTSE